MPPGENNLESMICFMQNKRNGDNGSIVIEIKLNHNKFIKYMQEDYCYVEITHNFNYELFYITIIFKQTIVMEM